MRALRSFVVTVVAFVVLAAPMVVLADGRVALVVGNSTYAHIGRLPNADNDAAYMSAALRRLGFEVTTELDADRPELTEALRAFTRRSVGADVALVFYAGHGIEMDRGNYLVPVDARLERDIDLRFEAVTLDDMLASTGGRKFALSKAQVRLAQAAMTHRDTSVSALCRELGIRPVTLYRYVGPQGQLREQGQKGPRLLNEPT